MNLENVIAISISLLTAIGGVLAYFNQKKLSDNDRVEKLVQNALKLAEQVEPLSKRIDELELENAELIITVEGFKEQKKMLEKKVEAMEIAIMESPIYRKLFEAAVRPCIIFNALTGETHNSNYEFNRIFKIEQNQSFNFLDSILNIDVVKRSLDNKSAVIENVFISLNQKVLRVKLGVVYTSMNGEQLCLGILSIQEENSTEARIKDLLCQIILENKSDYATLWAIHRNGIDKISAINECSAKGNTLIFQNYRDIPLHLYDDLFECFKSESFALVRKDSEEFDSVRKTVETAKLEAICVLPIYNKSAEIVGLLTTSWKNNCPSIEKIEIDKLKSYAKSNLIQDIMDAYV